MAFNLMALDLILGEMEYEVDQALSGQEAMQLYITDLQKTCECPKYKIVFTDFNMPEMDGAQTCVELLKIHAEAKAQNVSRIPDKLPVVCITAYDD